MAKGKRRPGNPRNRGAGGRTTSLCPVRTQRAGRPTPHLLHSRKRTRQPDGDWGPWSKPWCSSCGAHPS